MDARNLNEENMDDYIIKLKDVSFRYDGSDHDTVKNISLNVKKGEFLAVLGRNGSGKSTMAKLFNALLVASSGEVEVYGINPADEDSAYEVRTHCGMVFQNPDNQIVSTIVEEDCAFGLENLSVPTDEIRRRVDEALKTVGMAEYAQSAPHMLSGGQKQRVAVAGVVAMKPEIIIFDESTAMLDPVGRRDIFALAKKLNSKDGITVVWITHFMEEAVSADRLIVMDSGTIAFKGDPDDVFRDTERLRALGLDVPEMAYLSLLLKEEGIDVGSALTLDEMAVKLCRLK